MVSEDEKKRFFESHRDLLVASPPTREDAKRASSRVYQKTKSVYDAFPIAVKIILALCFLVLLFIFIPFVCYAAYDAWNEPAHRARLLHSCGMLLFGALALFLLFSLLRRQL